VHNIDIAADGRVVAAVTTEETALGGADALTSQMVMLYDPVIDDYLWSMIILDAVHTIDVHFAHNDNRVLVNWVEWTTGNTRRDRRARQLKSVRESEYSNEKKKRDRRRRHKGQFNSDGN